MSFPIGITDTFPENWPTGLKKLAAPTTSIQLSPEDAHALGTFSSVYRQQTGTQARDFLSDALLTDIETALEKYPSGVMPRIGYCSWKASLIEKRAATTLNDVLRILTTDDPRVGNALAIQTSSNDDVVLHLREWRQIPEWCEMRLFVRGGRYVGASQYAYRKRYAEVTQHAAHIEDFLQRTVVTLLAQLHLQDVVVDVALIPTPGQDPQTNFAPLLIELNPFGPLSDACLFSWEKGGDFDGRFRYRS